MFAFAGSTKLTSKVREPEYSPVVPPDEATNSALEKVCDPNVGPEFISAIYVLWRESCESCRVAAILRTPNVVDWYQNTAAYDGKDHENVAKHTQEPQAEHCI
jgi:hypothetical protein